MRTSNSLAYLFLPFNDMRQLSVGDSGVQLALHEGRSFVVFDVSEVTTFRHFDVFGKALRGKNKLQKGPDRERGDRSKDNVQVMPTVPAS